MSDSALKGVFTEYTLTYEVESGGFTTDSSGNQVPITSTAQLVILFEPYQFPQLIYQPGVDAVVVRGKCTCISPSTLPAAVQPGREFNLTYQGRAGKLRVDQVSVEALSVIQDALGQEFLASWRPNA